MLKRLGLVSDNIYLDFLKQTALVGWLLTAFCTFCVFFVDVDALGGIAVALPFALWMTYDYKKESKRVNG